MCILVTGSRRESDQDSVIVDKALDALVDDLRCCEITLMQGGARGVDSHAANWAFTRGLGYLTVPARWDQFGNAAGPRRNALMVRLAAAFMEDGYDTHCIAFPAPNSRGTWNCVKLAKEAGIPVEVHKLP